MQVTSVEEQDVQDFADSRVLEPGIKQCPRQDLAGYNRKCRVKSLIDILHRFYFGLAGVMRRICVVE